jgi:hypothetical protein
MEIRLSGYQIIEAAEEYLKKHYNVVPGVPGGNTFCEAWAEIDHHDIEYQRTASGQLKRKNGQYIVDEEKSTQFKRSFPVETSLELSLDFVVVPRSEVFANHESTEEDEEKA